LAHTHPAWALGYEDETWWSRIAQPTLHTWTQAGQPLRLIEQTVAKADPDPKALACYGLLLRGDAATPDRVLLRFVDGRPVSAVTTQFLTWCAATLEAAGKTALLLVWDNASWHGSAAVRAWVRGHNQRVKQEGHGVHILVCFLPSESPWLNAIEPHWTHSKKRVVEPDRLLTAQELADRVCAALAAPHESHLSIPKKVA
jgi:transposase